MTTVRHKFVEFIPKELDEGIIYVSVEYGTASHKCCCGCGRKVVTPLSPTDWAVSVANGRVSLDPSIGNWSFDCRSHYWIKKGQVIWARQWSQEEIDAGRSYNAMLKERYYSDKSQGRRSSRTTPASQTTSSPRDSPTSLWLRFRKWLSQKD